MIDIEKYITIPDKILTKILSTATLSSSFSITDEFYDISDFTLAKENKWLSFRDKTWKLTMPLVDYYGDNLMMDKYLEVEDENEIKHILKLGQNKKLLINSLKDNNYSSFAKLSFTRSQYKLATKNNQNLFFIIDKSIDNQIIKIVSSADELEEAIFSLYGFLSENNISMFAGYNKIISYIKKNNSSLFDQLVELNILNKAA